MELQIKNISKQFKEKPAVSNLTLTLTPGVWGLLGANGAGKTTLMQILAGILPPDQGSLLYNGIPIQTLGAHYREIFGYLPQEFGFHPSFTVTDYLEYIAALKGISKRKSKRKISSLLEQLSLSAVSGKRIAKLSGGMKRRVGIAQALLNDPEVLILDEPTAGLDPGERVRFRNLISAFAQNRIVLVSTHIVSDVEYIAACHALMKNGRLLAVGTTEELVKLIAGKVYSCNIPADAVSSYESRLQVIRLRSGEGGSVSVRYLADCPCSGDSILQAPSLEDVYLWMFPQAAADDNRRYLCES